MRKSERQWVMDRSGQVADMLQLESRRWLEGGGMQSNGITTTSPPPPPPASRTHRQTRTCTATHKTFLPVPSTRRTPQMSAVPDGGCKWSISSWETNVAGVSDSWRSRDASPPFCHRGHAAAGDRHPSEKTPAASWPFLCVCVWLSSRRAEEAGCHSAVRFLFLPANVLQVIILYVVLL